MDIRKKIQKAQRIVFKFGTNVLSREDGSLSLSRIYSFIESIADLKKQGKEIIVVSSGAVGLGAQKLKIKEKPTLVSMKQACAAVGQGRLMYIYEEGFEKFNITTAQVLLTEEDFSVRYKYLSLRNTLQELISLGVIPIINQNDTVSSSEVECFNQDGVKVCFGDNDKLSALVMSKLDADLLVILSDVDGLYDGNPNTCENVKIIPLVKEITDQIEALGFEASKKGRGGMKTKLEAAKLAVRSGGFATIANGKQPDIINRIFKGEELGTIFLPFEHLSSRKRWIGYATNTNGTIQVNSGAKKALVQKEASLLPIGVVQVKNRFNLGDVVSILDEHGEEFAKGMVNYSSADCKKIAGKHSDEIEDTLGHKNHDALITRDNIVIL